MIEALVSKQNSTLTTIPQRDGRAENALNLFLALIKGNSRHLRWPLKRACMRLRSASGLLLSMTHSLTAADDLRLQDPLRTVSATTRRPITTGEHDLTAYDWACYMDFADKHWNRSQLDAAPDAENRRQ